MFMFFLGVYSYLLLNKRFFIILKVYALFNFFHYQKGYYSYFKLPGKNIDNLSKYVELKSNYLNVIKSIE